MTELSDDLKAELVVRGAKLGQALKDLGFPSVVIAERGHVEIAVDEFTLRFEGEKLVEFSIEGVDITDWVDQMHMIVPKTGWPTVRFSAGNTAIRIKRQS